MKHICDRIRQHEPSKFKRIDKSESPHDSYSCPKEVSETFPLLTKSSTYTWRNNKVVFYYTNENTDVMFKYVDCILNLLQQTYPLNATILLSPAKKFYPEGKIFGQSHVNTGYSSSDGIVVYRKEEWFKVFIHECFHFFKLDHMLFDPSYSKRILTLFPAVISEVNIYESYCETWARVLNCCMIAEINHSDVNRYLNHEKKYSRRHMVNVLHKMGITFDQLFNSSYVFKEETNVLAYVVIGAILMNTDYIEKNQNHFDGFKLINPEGFISFIEQNHNLDEFVLPVRNIVPMKTTTMSLYNIDDYIA